MAYLDVRGAAVVVVDRLYQQLTRPNDGMRNDIDANRPAQCPTAPHKNPMASLVASNPKMIHEPLETFVCNTRTKRKMKRKKYIILNGFGNGVYEIRCYENDEPKKKF